MSIKFSLAIAMLAATLPVQAQAPDPTVTARRLEDQRKALDALDWMDGNWRGEATYRFPGGERKIVQTERIGGFLGDTIKLVEGRGFDAAGNVTFNAFAVVSFDPASGKYSMQSYSQGQSGNFPLTVTPDGFVWEIAAGPATIRYTVKHENGAWVEKGERLIAGQAPQAFFEMRLERFGHSDWPGAGALAPR